MHQVSGYSMSVGTAGFFRWVQRRRRQVRQGLHLAQSLLLELQPGQVQRHQQYPSAVSRQIHGIVSLSRREVQCGRLIHIRRVGSFQLDWLLLIRSMRMNEHIHTYIHTIIGQLKFFIVTKLFFSVIIEKLMSSLKLSFYTLRTCNYLWYYSKK